MQHSLKQRRPPLGGTAPKAAALHPQMPDLSPLAPVYPPYAPTTVGLQGQSGIFGQALNTTSIAITHGTAKALVQCYANTCTRAFNVRCCNGRHGGRPAMIALRLSLFGSMYLGEQVRSLRAGHVLQYPLSALFLTDALETGPVFFRFDHPLFAWQMIWQHLPEAFGGAGAALP